MNPVLTKLDTLPGELRIIIESEEIITIIDEIGERFNIPYAWRSELVRATVKVLAGTMRPGEFVPFIMEEYGFEQSDALQIALAVNERVFSAVKPQLASLHNIEDEKLARRIKVPHKPHYENVAPATVAIEPETVAEETPSQIAPAPATQIAPATPYSMPKPESIFKPMPTPVIAAPTRVATPEITTPIASGLSSKLGGLRADPYKEAIM